MPSPRRRADEAAAPAGLMGAFAGAALVVAISGTTYTAATAAPSK